MHIGRIFAYLTAVLLAAMAIPALALPSANAQVPSSRVTLRIVAIDRAGTRIAVTPEVIQPDGSIETVTGQSARLAPGRYIVGAAVPTPVGGAAGDSYTLVARELTVTRATTVTLDARTGRLLTVAFDASGARQVVQGAVLCNGSGATVMLAGVYDDPTGTTYVAPVPRALRLFYSSRWQSGTGTLYDLAGEYRPGSTSAPAFRDSVAKLAKVSFALRAGTSAAGSGSGLALTEGSSCAPGSDILPVTAPWAATDYVQAGTAATVTGNGAATLWWSGKLAARRGYAVSFGSAAYGPWVHSVDGTTFPESNGTALGYNPGSLFADPVAQNISNCSGRLQVTLHQGSTLLARRRLGTCWQGVVTRRLSRPGWYRLAVTGRQPGAELSGEVTPSWHLYFRPGARLSWPRALPVTITEFRPGGLDLANAARAQSRQ